MLQPAFDSGRVYAVSVTEFIGAFIFSFIYVLLYATLPHQLGVAYQTLIGFTFIIVGNFYVVIFATFAHRRTYFYDPVLFAVFGWHTLHMTQYGVINGLVYAFTSLAAQSTGALGGVLVARVISTPVAGTSAIVIPRAPLLFGVAQIYALLVVLYLVFFVFYQQLIDRLDRKQIVRALPFGFLYGVLSSLSFAIAGTPLELWASLFIGAFYGSLDNWYIVPCAMLTASALFALVFQWLMRERDDNGGDNGAQNK